MPTASKTIAFVAYPGLTPLDLIGPLQVLVGLGAPYETVVVGQQPGPLATDLPLQLVPSHTFEQVPSPSILVVPGGVRGTFEAMTDENLLCYIRSVADTAETVASVCTGSLILASAGLLRDRRATTHWACRSLLNQLGARYVRRRWVEDGKFLTAAGVSAGLDMALFLASRLTNEENARKIQACIEYDPEPPFGAMDWGLANASLWRSYSRQHPDYKSLTNTKLLRVLAKRPSLLAEIILNSLKRAPNRA